MAFHAFLTAGRGDQMQQRPSTTGNLATPCARSSKRCSLPAALARAPLRQPMRPSYRGTFFRALYGGRIRRRLAPDALSFGACDPLTRALQFSVVFGRTTLAEDTDDYMRIDAPPRAMDFE